VVLLTKIAQPGTVEKDGLDWRRRARVEAPVIRREEPRPAKHVARSNGLDEHTVAFSDFRFQFHAPAPDEIKPVGRIAFAKNHFAFLELGQHRAFGQNDQMLRRHAFEKRMVGDQFWSIPALP
jgi:hypothetical protein